MIVKLLTEHHLEFLSLKGGYRGSSESTLVKMSNCWRSHAAAQYYIPVVYSFRIVKNKRFELLQMNLISVDNYAKLLNEICTHMYLKHVHVL